MVIDPPPPWKIRSLPWWGGGMDIFWNHTLPNFMEVSSLQPIPPPLPELSGTHYLPQPESGPPSSSLVVFPSQLLRYNPFETVPVTVSTQVQPQEQAGSLRRYHPEPVPVTDSEQVSQKQPESLHHALSRVTGTVETFPRFVHLSVLWLVINTAVLGFIVCGKMRDKVVTKCFLLMQSAHTFYYSIFYAFTSPPHPTRPLSWFLLCLNQPLKIFLAARTTPIIFINSLSLFAFFVLMNE